MKQRVILIQIEDQAGSISYDRQWPSTLFFSFCSASIGFYGAQHRDQSKSGLRSESNPVKNQFNQQQFIILKCLSNVGSTLWTQSCISDIFYSRWYPANAQIDQRCIMQHRPLDSKFIQPILQTMFIHTKQINLLKKEFGATKLHATLNCFFKRSIPEFKLISSLHQSSVPQCKKILVFKFTKTRNS